jgi:hypothetical protein
MDEVLNISRSLRRIYSCLEGFKDVILCAYYMFVEARVCKAGETFGQAAFLLLSDLSVSFLSELSVETHQNLQVTSVTWYQLLPITPFQERINTWLRYF